MEEAAQTQAHAVESIRASPERVCTRARSIPRGQTPPLLSNGVGTSDTTGTCRAGSRRPRGSSGGKPPDPSMTLSPPALQDLSAP